MKTQSIRKPHNNQHFAKMKRIAYLLTDSGVDGMAPTTIQAAFWDESERDKAHASDKNKNWLSPAEKIVDVESATKQALAELDGLQKLLLGIE